MKGLKTDKITAFFLKVGTWQIRFRCFSLKVEETVDSAVCWLIEARAKDSSDPFAVRLIRVRKDNYLTAGTEYFDRQGKLVKQLAVSEITQINGI